MMGFQFCCCAMTSLSQLETENLINCYLIIKGGHPHIMFAFMHCFAMCVVYSSHAWMTARTGRLNSCLKSRIMTHHSSVSRGTCMLLRLEDSGKLGIRCTPLSLSLISG